RAGRRAERGEVVVQTRYPGHPLFAALARQDFTGFADSELNARASAGFPPCVFEAALRAAADELSRALAFLGQARTLVDAPGEVRVFDPVPATMTRRAGLERAQLVMQSASRPALQDYLTRLSADLFRVAPR